MLRIELIIVCLVTLPIIAQAVEFENLITNHSFEDDTDHPVAAPDWGSWFSAGNAEGVFSYDSSEAIDGEKSRKCEILQPSATNWHIGLIYTGLSLTKDQEYTLTFWAKAEVNRPLGMEVKRQPGGMDHQGITTNDYNITTEWAEYTQSFIPERDYPEENGLPADLDFWLAADKSTIWFDFVHLYEGKYVEIEPDYGISEAVEPVDKLSVTWGRLREMP